MSEPIPMILTCPVCCIRHIDEGIFATKPHHTHACQGCGLVWRPAKVDTVGVQFLSGYKNDEPSIAAGPYCCCGAFSMTGPTSPFVPVLDRGAPLDGMFARITWPQGCV